MTEILSTIWIWIVSAVGGVGFAGILSAIIYGCLKGAFSKTIDKINVEKIADKATDKGVERVKKISFSHNIQHLVESELKKIHEENAKIIENELKIVKQNYLDLVNVFEKFATYFDNSFAVNEETKNELKNAIANAKGKNESKEVESVVSEEVIEDKTEKSKNANLKSENIISVQR